MMNGTSTHFVLSAGYGSGGGSGGGYNRGRNDYQNNDDRGSGGYSRGGRNDYQSSNDDRGSGGYNRGRNDYHHNSDGGGGGGYGGDDNRMETQRDTIFIQNLPRNVTSDELREVFSQIGMIKLRYYSWLDVIKTGVFFWKNDRKTGAPKIWIYKDKTTGEGKGEATITYDDEEAAQAAINWYNGKIFFIYVIWHNMFYCL
jgi:RNA-binding protein FUS